MEGEETLYRHIKNYPQYFNNDLIKEPQLIFLTHQLINIYPNSKYIFVVRHPVDNIRSILDRVEIDPNNLPSDVMQVKVKPYSNDTINNFWRSVLDGSNLKQWHDPKPTDFIYNLSMRWNIAISNYQQLKSKALILKYEDFCGNKQKEIENLCAKMGINQQYDIENLVNNTFQPRGKNRNIDVKSLFKHEDLNKIQNICADQMKWLGYEQYRSL